MLDTKTLKRYWLNNANKYLAWGKKPKTSLTKNNNYLNWFPDGKINLYENCILKNLKKFPKKIAIIALDKDKNIKKYNFQQIDNLVLEFERKFFFDLKKKQRVVIHASSSIESAISMLACIKNGFHLCSNNNFDDEASAISRWLKILQPAYEKIIGTNDQEKISCLEKLSIINSMENLKKYPFIGEGIESDTLNICGIWNDIGSGEIHSYNEKTKSFEKV